MGAVPAELGTASFFYPSEDSRQRKAMKYSKKRSAFSLQIEIKTVLLHPIESGEVEQAKAAMPST